MRELTMLYVHGNNMGYGRMGTEIAKALEADGVDLYDSLGVGPPQFDMPEAVERTMATHFGVSPVIQRKARVKKTNAVCWFSTPGHASWWWQGQRPSIVTMWEAQRLPEPFREQLHEFETVIVPSAQNVELFSRYHDNVQYMPLGVDPEVWHYTPRQQSRYFNFLIGGSGLRKGTDLAYKAFMRVFGDWDGKGREPRLLMKNPRGEDFAGPRVQMTMGRLSAEEEVALYEEAHCYLQPSRGEGFGLQPIQALAQGIPTILTAAHGHAAFAHLGIPLDSTPSKSAYFVYGDAGDWWEPDFEQLCEAMRDVYANAGAHNAIAEYSAIAVAANFTWARTAQRFQQILGDQLTTPYTGDSTWVLPERKLYEVITNKDWVADIGGTVFNFTKGVAVHAPADVKRVLFEGELLDPACLDPDDEDMGLAPEQVERLGKYLAAHSACPACHQTPGLTRADVLFEISEALAPWQEMVQWLLDDPDSQPANDLAEQAEKLLSTV